MNPIKHLALLLATFFIATSGVSAAVPEPPVTRSVSSGMWSAAGTWQAGRVPRAGDKVHIVAGHSVTYDVVATDVIRSIHLDGVLRFAADRNTRLETGLIRIGAGGNTDEQGFDCDGHAADKSVPAALLVGEPNQPIATEFRALIRLHFVAGLDKQSCPAIVCCGGRMEFHGAALARTWTKLAEPAAVGASEVSLVDEPTGWRVGDRIILTATTRQQKNKKTFKPSTRDSTQTEERTIRSVNGRRLKFDRPLEFEHVAQGAYRGDVANLSRNVIVESADPAGVRGHTMYHVHSTGSISYAEFRHLGKADTLGRYSLHFHLCGDTLRGSSVIGASIWDSHNRWLTIHGTNHLVVRDCVGYQSRGHGFFLEDGTEVDNVLDRNLAVQAYTAQPLPKQVLPFDKNDGSGFWWANSHNAFTRNVAAECDEYGYFFQATKTAQFDPVLMIRQPDGSKRAVDIRTLPFVRFEDNEAHCQRRHGFNLGGGVPFGPPHVNGVGPDAQHPFVLHRLRFWNVHWAVHPVSPSVLMDDIDIAHAEYGVWRPEYRAHAYRAIRFDQVPEKLHYAFTVTNAPPNVEAEYPLPLAPQDDEPPATVITHTRLLELGRWLVRGTTIDNGTVERVLVNGRPAESTQAGFAQWQIELAGVTADTPLTAAAIDTAGNQEKVPHRRLIAANPE